MQPTTGTTQTPPQLQTNAGTAGFVNAQGIYTNPGPSSPVSSTIDASKVATVSPASVSSTSPVDLSSASLASVGQSAVQNATNFLTNQNNIANTKPDAAGSTTDATDSNNNGGVLSYLRNLIGLDATKGQVTTNLQNENDIAGKTTALATANNSLTDINNKAIATSKSWDDQINNARNNSAGQTQAGVNETVSMLTQKKNQDMANIALLQLSAQGGVTTSQANLKAANDIISQKVDAQFKPIEDNIKNLEDYATLNQNDLSKSEQMKLQGQIDTQKSKAALLQTSYSDVLKAASANGAPQSVLQAIDKAAGDPNATASSIYAAGGSWLKTAKATTPGSDYQEIDITAIKDKNAANPAWGGLSYNGLYNDAEKFLATGAMPSLGLGTAGGAANARFAIQNYAGQLADQLGMSQPQIQAMYKANSTAAGQIIGRMAKIDTISSSATTQFPRLADLANKVKSLGITESDIQAGVAKAKSKFGSVDAANYIELLQSIRGDYSGLQGAMGGSTQGGVFFNQKANEAIPAGLSGDQYLGIMQTMQTSAINVSNATQDEANKLIGIGSGNATGPAGGGTPTQSLSKGTQAQMNGKTYSYNGTGDTSDIANWTAQ